MTKSFLKIILVAILLGIIIYGFKNLVNDKKEVIKEPLIWKNIEEIKDKVIEEPKIEIIVTGDVMLGRSVMIKCLNLKDFNYPFLKTAEVLQKADITFGNLENPITNNCPTSDGGFTFCADKKMISGLSYAGFDVVNLANNHTLNYGEKGLKETEKFLEEAKIDYTGVDNLAIKEVKGIKFGFLGFDYVFQNPKESDYELIKNSKEKVDVLMVMPHWGVEYKSKSNAFQQETAKKIIDSGADIIVGGHPHWPQEIGYINDKPVIYSLGNFVFDQSWSEETKRGLVVRLNYKGKKLEKIDELPIYMKNFAQPEWVN